MKAALFGDSIWIDQVLLSSLKPQIDAVVKSSETSRRFAHNLQALDDNVLARHLVEHVFRIRMFRPLDMHATKWLSMHAPDAEKAWAAYARSEAVHDRYFLRDLAAMGLGRDKVDSLRPFAATAALGAFISEAMDHYGALPVVLYSYWTEQNSDVGSADVIALTRDRFGEAAVRGAQAHRALDEREDHADEVTGILTHLIADQEDLALAVQLLRGISFWLSAYFAELEEWCAGNSLGAEAKSAFAVP
ncbi:MAG: hypothetical protein QNJ44_17155 [Rhodobacter sp.]|nr:hypothetical protein [Rhodobacter sp.]